VIVVWWAAVIGTAESLPPNGDLSHARASSSAPADRPKVNFPVLEIS
jgi:hypothetical protein